MNVVCIVQARLGSVRFPMKVLADLCGKPMISHVLERAAQIKGIDKVVLAVPSEDVSKLKHLWKDVFGGSENNVLERYAKCAEYYKADVVVRVTGDCPLLAPDLASVAVKAFLEIGKGYLALCQPYANVADGWDVEVFSNELLQEADQKARVSQREHVVTWMREHATIYRVPFVHDCSKLKLSVDTREDLARVRLVMEFLHRSNDYDYPATWEAWKRAGRP